MIAAELKYRGLNTSAYITSENASINFFCDSDALRIKLGALMSAIENYQYKINKAEIECIKNIIEIHNQKIQALRDELIALKRQSGIIIFKKKAKQEAKRIRNEINAHKKQIAELNSNIEKLDQQSFPAAIVLKSKYKATLKMLGFTYKTSQNINVATNSDIYEATLTSEQLFKRAKTMLKKLEVNRELNILEIRRKYKKLANDLQPNNDTEIEK